MESRLDRLNAQELEFLETGEATAAMIPGPASNYTDMRAVLKNNAMQ
jgi:hypothetical protein